ncbi:MAG: DsbA family protein [Phycisphaerales bacterium]|nr:MAG: DsbA family protein [Phycisphaerales bacterium]
MRLRIIIVFFLCAAGALISWQLLHQSLGHSSGGGQPGFLARICGAANASGLACDPALDSKWSRLTVPLPLLSSEHFPAVRKVRIPVAFLGASYFVLLAVWFGTLGGPRAAARGVMRLPLHAANCGLVASVFYSGLMATGAAPPCIWCVLVHLINLAVVVGTWGMFRDPERKAVTATAGTPQVTPTAIPLKQILTSLALAMVIIAAIGVHYRQERLHVRQLRALRPYRAMVATLQHDPDFLLREFSTQRQYDIPPRTDEPGQHGRALLVVFTDYECRSCYCDDRALREEVIPLVGDRIEVAVRHYPLCAECNTAVTGSMHANACDAAFAAEAARLLGGAGAFERMHCLLFEHQAELKPELYDELAVEAGLDPDAFRRAMQSEQVRQVVRDDIALAEELGVNGTPTLFLDGRRVPHLCRTPVFWRAFAQDRAQLAAGDGTEVAGVVAVAAH